MAAHYYRPRSRKGPRMLVSDYLRGVTVEFYVSTEVFSPREVDEGTRLLIEHAIVPEEGTVLDMGCGYGAIGITLAKAHPRLHVVMVDVNPKAVELARLNARHNGVENRVEVLQGDLYEPVKGYHFDAIISNPPLAAGMKIIEKLILEAPAHLKPGGSLQIVMRKGAEKAKELMQKAFGNAKVLLRKKGYTILYAEKPS
ncbi:class I SAM-dependent methyltransferase [Hyperthermus butylicus]|uniref:Methyltransferase n=1 Tax=Hyperthermus butylicus (strain DSM 5456 / JCM 9403 / PLM1-5) TaxID=415426 RepID=A2BME9_HYPBU|nr:methyltransferase [Hyperthermus butylicus]ABM81160.1 putative Methyltransferase [Hyperthermus butylicus DSM 5456]